MNTITHVSTKFNFNKEKALAYTYVFLAVLAAVTLFMGIAEAAGGGGGTSLNDFNDWMEDELGGSLGTAIGLVAFLSGLIGAVATRTGMPLIWGMGIGILLAIFLEVVINATSAGMPLVTALPILYPVV